MRYTVPARKPPGTKAKPDSLDGLPQIDRFKAVARELECDEDPAAFEAALRKIAKHKPSKDETKERRGLRRGG